MRRVHPFYIELLEAQRQRIIEPLFLLEIQCQGRASFIARNTLQCLCVRIQSLSAPGKQADDKRNIIQFLVVIGHVVQKVPGLFL